jgi:oligopeptide/dipeptide ABC transporter ATP-binding protein
MPIIVARNLVKTFVRGGRPILAVNDVSFSAERGDTLAIIGESGSGKSTLGRLVLGLDAFESGTIHFDGHDVAKMSRAERRAMRADLQVVFQEPFESLNPRMTVEQIVGDLLEIHEPKLSSSERRKKVFETLELVGLDTDLARRYPRNLSGGQQQRIGIARAIVTRPTFVVLDEPTSSLDVSVQANILHLLAELQRAIGVGYLYISHDIGTVEFFSSRVAVMYAGRIVEIGDTDEVLERPQHPYTQALLAARLSVVPGASDVRFSAPRTIASGGGPELCPYLARCPIALDRCRAEPVPLHRSGSAHEVACHAVTGG